MTTSSTSKLAWRITIATITGEDMGLNTPIEKAFVRVNIVLTGVDL